MLLSCFFVFIGPVLRLSRRTWAGLWLGIEINLFSVLVVINLDYRHVVEPLVKYFVVQRVGSILIIRGFLFNSCYLIRRCLLVRIVGAILKGGLFPFHSWVPSVVSSCKWSARLLILTWQKLVPSFIFFSLRSYYWYNIVLVGMGVVGAVGGLNQHSVRAMCAYSSFVHIAWIIAAIRVSMSLFFIYFFLYCIPLRFLFFTCKKLGKDSLKIKSNRLLSALSLIIMRGLPPFVGFLIKVLVFLRSDSYIVVFCIVASLVRIKFYLSFIYGIVLVGSPSNNKTRFVLICRIIVNIVRFMFLVLLFL